MRKELNLNGRWKFYPAFDEVSGDQKWMDPDFDPADFEITPKEGMAIGWIKEEFDDSGWLDSPVPSSWNAAFEDLWSYEGHGWYRRKVLIPNEWEGKRVEFFSEGANYRTALYVNGAFAGEHFGGYTPFGFPVHELLKFGEVNTIAIECDNVPKSNRCPGGQFDWWNEGGLYRDVCLRVTDPTYIDDVTVVTRVSSDDVEMTVDIEVCSDEPIFPERSVALRLSDPAGDYVPVPASVSRVVYDATLKKGHARFCFSVPSARLWSPETPHLYQLDLTLVDTGSEQPRDWWSHRIGLREFRVDGPRLLLNGKPLVVKGVNTYEDYPVAHHSHNEAALGQDLDLLKWIGGNAFRSHVPAHRRRYELSDERGVLQLVELPFYQWGRPLVQTDNPDALADAKGQLRELIKARKNHASVFMWSVSNECLVVPRSNDPQAVSLARMTAEGNIELVKLAHELDPTRPVVEVSNCWPGDPVHEHTDLPCVNVYVGSAPHVNGLPAVAERIREKFEALRKDHPDKPILAGEWGSWCVRGVKTDYFPGEVFQAEKIRLFWETMREEENFIGGFIWCFADYDVHRRFLWVYEYRCAYGLFDYHRRPKEAAYAVRRMWTGKGN
ncbi:MAG: Beta-glucuronidase [Candidatus Latescibacteria bacterium ADurb.Bin168]|nr:MAG: Beta-glucuronidase [Candidatus Latescibacteria bacterium ADurb.Bin168]